MSIKSSYAKKNVKQAISNDRKKKKGKKRKDLLLNVQDLAVETGVSDLAKQHDHYLYGVPKKNE